MMRKYLLVLLFLAGFLFHAFFSVKVFPEEKKIKWEKSKYGLGALIDYAKSAGQMQKDAEEEDENFEKAYEAVNSDELKAGMQASDVEKWLGNPAVSVPDPSGGEVRWVYKKGSASYFDGQKVYLFFDDKNMLTHWDLIPKKEPKEVKSEAAYAKKDQSVQSDKTGDDTSFVSVEKEEKPLRSVRRRVGLL